MAIKRDLTRFLSVEHQLLLALARTKQTDATRTIALRLIQSKQIDWNKFISMATVHGVLLMVYRQLQQIAPDVLPAELRASVQSSTFRDVMHNLEVTKELTQVADLLRNNNIPMLTYKGPTLAQMMYGSIAFRYFSDVDMLVPPEDLLKAKTLIIEQGYYAFIDDEHREFQKEDADRSYQGYDLIRNDGQVAIDLQERSGLRYSSFFLSFNELWARRQEVRFGDVNVACPSMEDYLWMLCAHGTQHRWYQLKWICDIAQLVTSVPDLDWHILMERAWMLKTERMIHIGVLLANLCLDMPIPESMRVRIESDKAAVRMAEQVAKQMFLNEQTILAKMQRAVFDYTFDLTVRPAMNDKRKVMMFLTRRRLNRRLVNKD